jgi:hypothetical protein
LFESAPDNGTDARPRSRPFFGASSEWQSNTLKRALSIFVFVTSALVFFFFLFNGLFEFYASASQGSSGEIATASESLLSFLEGVFFGGTETRFNIELAVSLTSASIMLVSARSVWRFYRKGYEIKEEPVDFPCSSAEPKWHSIYAPEAGLEKKACAYADEFLINALVEPRMVFARISESVSPGRRMLDCTVNYEIVPPSERGLRVFDAGDLVVDKNKGKAKACSLIVPVSFQKRGMLAMKQVVRNASGAMLPVVKQSEFAAYLLKMIEGFLFRDGESASIKKRWIDLEPKLKGYLSSMECNPNADLAVEAVKLMLASREGKASAPPEDIEFCRSMLIALVCLKDVIPVCVSLRAAVVPEGLAGSAFPSPVFGLRLEEKREMEVKPANAIPNRSNGAALERINRLARVFSRRSDTIYYNLARAGRSTSYHLYVEGPEGTYYSRGSLLRESTEDDRPIVAEHVEMQKRRGQRNAHIYIRAGHCMSNVVFMFRYKKAPLDTFHIMFIAALLCTTVLALCAMTSLASNGSGASSNLSMVTMLLAVVSAAGPWIYNRASDGREESFGIEVATIVMTVCAVSGMILFAYLGNRGTPSWSAMMWGLLVAVMGLTATMVGLVALMHDSLYRYLLDKPVESGDSSEDAPWSDEEILVETRDGMRLDTPQGRLAENPYSLWTEARVEFERACEEVLWNGKR